MQRRTVKERFKVNYETSLKIVSSVSDEIRAPHEQNRVNL